MKYYRCIERLERAYRRSSHEERGLKSWQDVWNTSCISRRSSHEERGLKSKNVLILVKHPSRSSHEERGLKFLRARIDRYDRSRSSHEERGLKSHI